MHTSFTAVLGVTAALWLLVSAFPAGLPSAQTNTGFDEQRLSRIDALIEEGIRERKLAGAVVLVGRGSDVAYFKAFGHRALGGRPEVMTRDTIFDVASLTKVVATATSMMVLIEEGRVRLVDRVAHYIPEFARYGKRDVTIRHLLTHVSGLRPDVDLADEWVGHDAAIARAAEEILLAPPGERFIYSDINYFLLGDIVGRVSGMPLDKFAAARVFEPLGMRETMFNPPATLLPRVAPTERCTPYGYPCEGPVMQMLRGTVHDPTARRMGGVAGHAGLFSTAEDLARYSRMVLGQGQLDGRRVLSPLAVAKMTSPATSRTDRNTRGLGWDIDSAFSANRGELLPIGSFGHTGFTGTSIWIDPLTKMYVVFLSSRLHPEGKGDVTPLRARIATAAAAALADIPELRRDDLRLTGADFGPAGPAPRRATARTLAGIDVLRAERFERLRGKRVGLITNHTGRAADGATTIDLLAGAPDVKLVALFSPEHGIRGILDANVPSSRDEKTGLPIHSLYGDTRRPTAEMMSGIDTFVIDLQDVGVRFYTYMTTMAYVMEEAAKRRLAVVVLDRPNPVNGFQIEGPVLDRTGLSFVGYFPMPIRHGMTMGELARLFNRENQIGVDLTVVEMQGWNRDQWFDETGLPWINPSPNMRNLIQATLYPGIGSIEYANVSVGRGTDAPFEQIGAPWIDGVTLAADLNGRDLTGIRFYPVTFTPASSKYKNELCQGVFMIVTDRMALRPVRVGLEIASALRRLYGSKFDLDPTEKLIGSKAVMNAIRAGEDPSRIAATWSADEARWRLLRAKYLIYR